MAQMMTEHDAELRVTDFDLARGSRGPSGKDFTWGRVDGRPILSPDEKEAMDELIDEAHDRVDIDTLDHGDAAVRIWLEDRSVEKVEWDV